MFNLVLISSYGWFTFELPFTFDVDILRNNLYRNNLYTIFFYVLGLPSDAIYMQHRICFRIDVIYPIFYIDF